jgi:SAM-dependent methyltransferase
MSKSATDKQWNAWGEKNPYFGVLGVESSALTQAEVEASFYATGEAHVSDVLDTIQHHFGGLATMGSALDFGCGVGRLVEPLARRFDRVTGVDISQAMIELARKRVKADPRVDFVESVDALEASRRYDLVHSYIVIQHIRPEQGYPIISALIDRVAPGGFFALHFTVGDLNRTRRWLNALRYRLPPLQWAYNLARKRPWDEPITEMNRYDIARLMSLLRGRYAGSLAFKDYDQNGHVGVMFVGRRA